jgi:hypothetical protein
MELAKITSKEQTTITNSFHLSEFQKAMEGAAKEAGFESPEDVLNYIKQLRKSKENIMNSLKEINEKYGKKKKKLGE